MLGDATDGQGKCLCRSVSFRIKDGIDNIVEKKHYIVGALHGQISLRGQNAPLYVKRNITRLGQSYPKGSNVPRPGLMTLLVMPQRRRNPRKMWAGECAIERPVVRKENK